MSEWDQRLLCPDGACVGVIGDDGTCKACGRAAPNWGEERKRGLADASDDDREDEEDDADDAEMDGEEDVDDGDDSTADDEGDEDDDEEDEEDDDEDGGEWSDRALCSNGACVGVIGEDGKCKVCGAEAA